MVPNYPVDIIWDHPLAQSLSFMQLYGRSGASQTFTRSGRIVGAFSSATITPGPAGVGIQGVNGAYLSTGSAANAFQPNTNNGTLLLHVTADHTSAAANQRDLFLYAKSGPVLLQLEPSSGSGPNSTFIGWYNGGSDTRVQVTPNGLYSSGDTFTAAVTWNATTPLTNAYFKGASVGTNGGAVRSGTISGGDYSVGATNTSSGYFLTTTTAGAIYSTMLWDVDLSAALMAWLDKEPYAMLQPIVRRVYSFPSAVTTVRPYLISW